MYETEIRQLLFQLAWTDDVSYYHSLRVGKLMALFAETEDGQKFVKQAWVTRNEFVAAGLLHEIGKITWPRELLMSTQRPNEMDLETLREFWYQRIRHPLVSESMLMEYYKSTGNRFWLRIAYGVAAHHENYGGGGYPYDLKGTEIPLLARGLRLIDSFAAMTEVRRYRKTFSPDGAVKEMGSCLGCRYDPFWGKIVLDFLKKEHSLDDLDDWLDEELTKNF